MLDRANSQFWSHSALHWSYSDIYSYGIKCTFLQITLLIHRRLKRDDGMGVDEALDDNSVVSGSHKVKMTSGNSLEASQWRRREALTSFKPLLMLYVEQSNQTFPDEFSWINEGQGDQIRNWEKSKKRANLGDFST